MSAAGGIDLVVQAPAIGSADVAALAALSAAQGIHAIATPGHAAYRLARAGKREGIAEFCAAAGIDWAFVAPDLRRGHVALVAMDMDSTLITIECVDEIADTMGSKRQVALITAAAMRGEIDFAESLVRRVALLAGLPVAALARVYDERVQLARGAEAMLAGFKAVGAKTLLASGGFDFFTERLRERLGFDETVANTLEIADGRLTGRLVPPVVGAKEKHDRFVAMRERYAPQGAISIAIGDGANDLPMLKAADVSIAWRAKPLVRAQASAMIDHCGLDAVLNLFV